MVRTLCEEVLATLVDASVGGKALEITGIIGIIKI